MISFEGLNENFHFLVLEVENQVYSTFDYLNAPEAELCERIIARDDYIDNLKNRVENDCFSKLLATSRQKLTPTEINTIRAMQIIAVNLERVADFCVNIVRQVHYLTDETFLYSFNYENMLTEIASGVQGIVPAMKRRKLSSALEICKTENRLDSMYKELFDRIMDELKTVSTDPADYITMLFIIRYLERIGDSLLNVGEAIIFAIIGEKIKINQFQALQETLNKSGFEGSVSDVDLKFILGTRSGCKVGRLENRLEDNRQRAQDSIFKEGPLKKIRDEKENLESWRSHLPGLVPKIFSYHEELNEDRGSMLLELLPGCTLDEAVLHSDLETLQNAVFILQETLQEVWQATRREGRVQTNFVDQVRERMQTVRHVHPGFVRQARRDGSSGARSTESLLQRCARFEPELEPPFSVFIHGDFNVNNIVYNHTEQKVHFIDLHRSRQFDYLQDISVFLISNFRMPVEEEPLRERINWTIAQMFAFARGLAMENGDDRFQARLALAVARSLYTSTRFELGAALAKEMFERSHTLLDRLAEHEGRDWGEFRFPEQILYYQPS